MINRKQKPCARDDCPWPRYGLAKVCASHYLEEHPPKEQQAKTRPPRQENPQPKKRAKAKPDDIPAEVWAIVLARCGGLCEACGTGLGYAPHRHHRMRRRDGGHVASNLVALHPTCHVVAPEAVHQRPLWARERGLIVPSWADPAATVLVLSTGRRVQLDDTTPGYLPPLDGVLYAA